MSDYLSLLIIMFLLKTNSNAYFENKYTIVQKVNTSSNKIQNFLFKSEFFFFTRLISIELTSKRIQLFFIRLLRHRVFKDMQILSLSFQLFLEFLNYITMSHIYCQILTFCRCLFIGFIQIIYFNVKFCCVCICVCLKINVNPSHLKRKYFNGYTASQLIFFMIISNYLGFVCIVSI